MLRIQVVIWAVIAGLALLVFGLLNLSILHGRMYQELGNKNCVRLIRQNGCRGRILDRQNLVIADSALAYDLMVLPQDSLQQEKIISSAAGILGVSVKDLKSAFKNNYISASVPVLLARNISVKNAISLAELKVDLPAIIVQPNPLRHYPHGKLAAHVLGYVSEIDHWRLTKLEDYGYKTKDIVGFGGVEEKYDYYLRQEEGGVSFEVDHRGKAMRTLGFKPPANGRDIQLSLDIRIQKISEDALADRCGAVVLMDPYSGEILAMVSSPGFNPEVFAQKDNAKIARLFNNPDSLLINRAISFSYPAGSVFKIVVGVAGLESRKINQNTSFLCQGIARIGNREFKCWSTHGTQDLAQALVHSCDIFFYKTGLLIGAQGIHDYSLKFGLSKTTGFELPYEEAGFIPSPLWRKLNKFRKWYDGDTANFSIGQGEVLVTPLQLTRMMAVFANEGYLVNPYIVKAIDGKDISIDQEKSDKLNIRKEPIAYIRENLRRVVSDPAGTGNVLASLAVSVAGKTSTAQAPTGRPHAWFTGFFPYQNPKFVICVFLEHGGSGYTACVTAKQIIQEMINQGLI